MAGEGYYGPGPAPIPGENQPHVPEYIRWGNPWDYEHFWLEIAFRRSTCHIAECPADTYVWLAEVGDPRWPDGSPFVQKDVAAWGWTPYQAYMRLRDKVVLISRAGHSAHDRGDAM